MDPSEGINEKKDDTPVCNEHLQKLMELYCSEDPKDDETSETESNLMEISSHFENFHYWELLPVEIRCMITKETDFITRFALMCTSKSNYEVARSVPILLKSVEVDEMSANGVFMITIFPKSGRKVDRVRITYSTHYGGKKEVSRQWNKHGSGEVEEVYHYDADFDLMAEMERFIENLLKLANYQVDEFTSSMSSTKNFGKDSIFLDKLQVRKKIYLSRLCDESTLLRWLDTVKAPLDRLLLCISDTMYSTCYVKHEAVKNAKIVRLWHSRLRDADLLNLKAEKIDIMFDNGITNNGINKFIRRWIDGEEPENFGYATIDRRKADSSILSNIKYHKWDEIFERENPILAEWIKSYFSRDICFYIETRSGNNGAILAIRRDNVTFMVTGKRC